MKKRWLVAVGLLIAMAGALAASITTPKPAPDSPAERARAEAVRAIVKERAEGARKRIRARLEKRAERQARSHGRATTTSSQPASPSATKPASKIAQPKKLPQVRQVAKASSNQTLPITNSVTAAPSAAPTVAMASPAPAAIRPPAPATTTPTPAPRKAIPKGFEEWFAPQKTAIDLYYGGRYLMTTLVEYTLDSVTFLNPPEIAAHVPMVRSAAELGVMLAETQPSNADKVCVRPNQPLCGRLEPNTIGVIFDETRFRADLFVHPSLLLEVQKGGKQYLPQPVHDHATLVQNLGVLYAGNEGDSRFSLLGRTRVGKGRQYGFANWASTDAKALGIDELGYTQDRQDTQITAGLFEPQIDALRAVPRQPIIGASIASSLLTRTDLESTLATPIELFLPVRGRVDIFRDGRLISTDFYEAGNQSIDTSRLPGGAYNIDIVVTDISGATRNVQQLFIKSTLMAPPGEPQWFADIGQVMRRNVDGSFPEDFGAMQLRGGYRWRQKPWLGLGTAAVITDSGGLAEFSGGLLLDRIEGSAELYVSSAGGSGIGLRGLTRHGELVIGASLQQSQADDADDPDTYRLLPSNHTLTSINASHPFLQGRLSASLSLREDAAGNSSERFTLGYSRAFRLSGSHALHLQTEVGDDDGNALALVTLQWRNIRGKWSDFAQVQLRQQDADTNADQIALAAGTTWRDGDRFVDDVQLDVRAEVGDQNHSLAVAGQHLSQYGRGKFGLTSARNNGLDRTLSSLGYDTSLVMGADGKTVLGGGPNLNTTAVIIDPGPVHDAFLEISADGQPQFIARGGRKTALTLPPYHQYRIRMKDTGMALTQFDDQAREVTLYPGHVVNLDWKVQSVQVLIARIMLAEGLPARHARIDGAEGMTMTDEEGFVQAEVRSDVRTLNVRHADGTCTVQLPPASSDNIIRAMKLHCQAIAAAPASEPAATVSPP